MDDSEPPQADLADCDSATGNTTAETGPIERFTGKGCLMGSLVIGACVALYVFMGAPGLTRVRGRIYSDQVVALNNGKSLMLELNDFASEYGSFPDRETAKMVRRNTDTNLDLDGDTANAYFRQLIAAGIAKSERPFFARTPYSLRQPDDNLQGPEALKAGEVGFAYVMDGNKAMDFNEPNRIIAVTPLLNATATGEFDPEPCKGHAVLVYLDCSTKSLAITKDHQVMPTSGKTLLETGPGTIWGTAIHPVIKPPQTPPQWRPTKIGGMPAGWWWLVGAAAILALGGWWFRRLRRLRPLAS